MPLASTERDEAIDFARNEVVRVLGTEALEERMTWVEREDDRWHVAFPWADVNRLGGEPHVMVDDTGAVLELYQTQ